MATADRVLSILGLFTVDSPEWTVEAVALELGLSGSTAYHYVRSLVDAGLLVSEKGGRYMVGPAIIELDRVTRRFDLLSNAAQDALQTLTAGVDGDAIGLLCRIYRLKVMCVDQCVVRPPSFAISYERGRPMLLTRGAASKCILANLKSRPLRKFYDSDPDEVRMSGLGDDWETFKRSVRELRKHRVLATKGELDPGLMGISAPVFDAEDIVIGSIGLVVSAPDFIDQDRFDAAKAAVDLASRTVSERLKAA
ncbi:MAG: helix-turn-helix domain-containing protein [Sphingobium sp.]|jgi:DNA-binding IclR family transcriptional regulator|nr:helix-turn-helix domain-containing protein [Sphingobium sp.]|tara:strand:+ start:13726 stop:14481 length:756 start_codon:yes stop_codon:yes gene_type:complete